MPGVGFAIGRQTKKKAGTVIGLTRLPRRDHGGKNVTQSRDHPMSVFGEELFRSGSGYGAQELLRDVREILCF